MKVLFIGGTGIISSACVELAVARGMDVWVLNRGKRSSDLPAGVKSITVDVRNEAEAARAMEGHTFDAVADFISFSVEQVEAGIRLFAGKCGQFLFISSASAYQKPGTHHVITESTPLANPFWEYSRNKIACEERLIREYRERGFPVVNVRPSHTYSQTVIPCCMGNWASWTIIDRMIKGLPTVVPGDGTSFWVMTHNTDFAKAFVGLLGNPRSIGHAFHITSDEVLSWDQIYKTVASVVGVNNPNLLHIASDFICKVDPGLTGSLIGDKSNSVIFDNSKIKSFVPGYVATVNLREGVERSVRWFNADPSRKTIDEKTNALHDRLAERYKNMTS